MQLVDFARGERAHRDPLVPENDVLVVKENGLSVARLPEIDLDGVDAEYFGRVEAVDRVLARTAGSAAVPDDPRAVRRLPFAHRDSMRADSNSEINESRAAIGSEAAVTGRPTTRMSAPALQAAAGVAKRF